MALDGSAHQAGSVLVANARFYAGRFVAAPAADLQSPGFQVCLFERSGRLAAIGYALALFTGRLPRLPSYRILAAGQVQIEGPPGEPVQADGDIIATLPARIEALPAALALVYPPGRERAEQPAASAASRPARAAARPSSRPRARPKAEAAPRRPPAATGPPAWLAGAPAVGETRPPRSPSGTGHGCLARTGRRASMTGRVGGLGP